MPYSIRSASRPTSLLHGLRLAGAAVVLAHAAEVAAAQDLLWSAQLGTAIDEVTNAATPDGAGGVYVGGWTEGNLAGPTSGLIDAWLARYDSAGNPTWIRQLGSVQNDEAISIAADVSSGVFVCGLTNGNLGGPISGFADAWIARYDTAGNQVWVVQLGSDWFDVARAAAPDTVGGVYVSGSTLGDLGGANPGPGTHDVWLARYDITGQQVWLRQFGTILDDVAFAAASDGSGGVYVCGHTSRDLAGPSAGSFDAWVARYDSAGTQLWIRQFGTSEADRCFGAARDGSGGVYVCGETGGTASSFDAWLVRFDGAGTSLWTRQIATSAADQAYAVAPDGAGGAFVSGTTQGSLGGPNAGGSDAWLGHYDGAGNPLGLTQLGTSASDGARAAATDGTGGVYVGGITQGSLGGPSNGDNDAWLMRFGECGSSSSYCSASSTSIAGCQAAIGSSGSPSLGNPAGFTIASGNVPGGNLGICFFGDNGPASTPFGTLGGLICVQGPFFRTGPALSGGSTGQCDGNYAFTLQKLIDSSPIVIAGATLHAAIWSRDPANPDGFLLSDGLEIQVCP